MGTELQLVKKLLITDGIHNYAICYKRIGKKLFDYIILKKWSLYGDWWFEKIYPSASWEGDLSKEDFLNEFFGRPIKDIRGAGNDRIIVYNGAFYVKGVEIKVTEKGGVFEIKYNSGTRKAPKWETIEVECPEPYPFIAHPRPGRGEWEGFIVSQKKINEKKFKLIGEGEVSISLLQSA